MPLGMDQQPYEIKADSHTNEQPDIRERQRHEDRRMVTRDEGP